MSAPTAPRAGPATRYTAASPLCWGLAVDEAEQDRRLDIAAGCGGTDVEFTPAPVGLCRPWAPRRGGGPRLQPLADVGEPHGCVRGTWYPTASVVGAGWCVEPKLDGLEVAARYRGGRLVQVLTRGDGLAGEDITHAADAVLGLPPVLTQPIDVELRGEVLLTTAQFEEANRIRLAHEATPFAHPRSGAAGTLRAKDRPYRIELTFFAYSAIGMDDLGHVALLENLAALGANTAAAPMRYETVEQVQERIDMIAGLRADLPFGIDGVVVKADTAEDQRQAGTGSRAPRWRWPGNWRPNTR